VRQSPKPGGRKLPGFVRSLHNEAT
jgi:hypothetical protein